MKSRDFCYWLQGYFELARTDGIPVLSEKKMECIEKHLAMVFKHEIDPSMGPITIQEELNSIHKPIGGTDQNGDVYRC